MEYRVEELAAAAGVRVDTLRFYQARHLLPPPDRRGRIAVYGDDHLDRLRRIRDLKDDGFSLAQIERVVSDPGSDHAAAERYGKSDAEQPEALLEALVQKSVGERTLSREQFAKEAGVHEALVRAAESTGLVEPLQTANGEHFTEADLELAKASLAILESGIPLQSLLEVASVHVRNIETVCGLAIDLFDDHVRKAGPAANNDLAIANVFRDLLPQVTRVVALHFQRTLVNRALARLEGGEEQSALEAALDATDSARLEVEWR